VKNKTFLIIFLLITNCALLKGQDVDYTPWIGIFGGAVSYQGDLQPTSFDFKHSRAMFSLSVRQPLSNKLSVRAGVSIGSLGAADRNNRDYLKPRNLSFKTNIQEAFVYLDWTLLDLTSYRISPFGYAGVAYFHFNPYTFDEAGQKVYLQPLSTEGQGLPDYPDRKVYSLYQPALTFGGGIRYAISNDLMLSFETAQRKSFIDYLDDVSKNFVDKDKLMAAKGPRAVELAFRGDEIHRNAAYPNEGEQRGTPTEMDWYYYMGITIETRLHSISQLGRSFGGVFGRSSQSYQQRCPRFF
jgi:hypothetical protein